MFCLEVLAKSTTKKLYKIVSISGEHTKRLGAIGFSEDAVILVLEKKKNCMLVTLKGTKFVLDYSLAENIQVKKL